MKINTNYEDTCTTISCENLTSQCVGSRDYSAKYVPIGLYNLPDCKVGGKAIPKTAPTRSGETPGKIQKQDP